MKYLDAFLKEQEIPQHPREEEPLKPRKPVLAVLAGAHGRSTEEIEQPPEPLACLPTTALCQERERVSWVCSVCALPKEIESIEQRPDGRLLTFWRCPRDCSAGVTPASLGLPPLMVRKILQKENLSENAPPASTISWPCPQCGNQVRLEPPADESAPTQLWTCGKCGTWGATREGAAWPAVWVTGAIMQ